MLLDMKILAALLFALVASANAQSSNAVLIGAGTQPCGKWIDARAKRGEHAELYESLISSWLQGFISALNTAGDSAPVGLPDPSTMNAFLDKWCRDNPLMETWTGGYALVSELRKQQRKK